MNIEYPMSKETEKQQNGALWPFTSAPSHGMLDSSFHKAILTSHAREKEA